MLDMRAIRKENNIKIKDMARELCMSEGQYTQHESGKRSFKNQQRHDEFIEDFNCAIEKLVKKREESLKEDYKPSKKTGDADDEILVWVPLTDDNFEEALSLLKSGKCENIIQVAIRLGVDELEIKDRLVENGYAVRQYEVTI